MDSPLVIVGRLTIASLLGVLLPQLLGLAARGLGSRPNRVRILLGVTVPAFTFLAIALVFVSTMASEHLAHTGHPACGGFGAGAFGILIGGPSCHGFVASFLQKAAADALGRLL
jgi:hypothetical protein